MLDFERRKTDRACRKRDEKNKTFHGNISFSTTAKSLKVGDDTYVSRRVLIHEQSASRDTYTISALLDVLIMIHDAHLGAIFSTSLPFVKKKHGNSCN
jgi:hypothetical protein